MCRSRQLTSCSRSECKLPTWMVVAISSVRCARSAPSESGVGVCAFDPNSTQNQTQPSMARVITLRRGAVVVLAALAGMAMLAIWVLGTSGSSSSGANSPGSGSTSTSSQDSGSPARRGLPRPVAVPPAAAADAAAADEDGEAWVGGCADVGVWGDDAVEEAQANAARQRSLARVARLASCLCFCPLPSCAHQVPWVPKA